MGATIGVRDDYDAGAYGRRRSVRRTVGKRRTVSWVTRMMCWRGLIWAEAGVVRQSAASVKRKQLVHGFPPLARLRAAPATLFTD
jgi:hypothetical protein